MTDQTEASIISTGQIESMLVPDGWVKRPEVTLRAGAGLTEYHPPGIDDVRLNSFYRGFRVNDQVAAAFKTCLAQPLHLVKMDELKSLAVVLDDKANNFNVLSAKTENWNGKIVLIVEGCYKDPERTTSMTIYVDSDHTGTAIQEISYTAPGALYQSNFFKAQKALKSIVWK